MAPAPATLDYGNRTVVNFQWVPGYPFEINTGTRAAVCHICDTPILGCHLMTCEKVFSTNSSLSPPGFVPFDEVLLYTKLFQN